MVRRCFYIITMVRTTILFNIKLLNYNFGLAYMFVQCDSLIPKLHQLIYGLKLTLTIFCNSSFTILYDFESELSGLSGKQLLMPSFSLGKYQVPSLLWDMSWESGQEYCPYGWNFFFLKLGYHRIRSEVFKQLKCVLSKIWVFIWYDLSFAYSYPYGVLVSKTQIHEQ